jgi:hypothetical protein
MLDSAEDTHMPDNKATLLMRQLLQKIEEIGNRERETSARMRMLEASSQTPNYTANATPTLTPTPTTTTTPPITEASGLRIHTTSKPCPSLPHPPMFSGNKSQWQGWKLEMEGKIEEDAPAIGSLKAQLRYIFMRLEGAAKTNITTFYKMQLGQDLPNPYQLIERLELLYRERNRKQKAIQNLHSIRQWEDETFITFYPRFEKEIANANAKGWDNDAKISYLCNALSNKMRDCLVGLSGNDTDMYAGFAQRCVDVSNDMELYGQWTKKRDAANSYTAVHVRVLTPMTTPDVNVTARINYEDMVEWKPTQPTTTQVNAFGLHGKSNTNGYPSKRPENRELLGKRAKWVNQGEIDAQRQDRRCLQCGRNNCRIATCLLAAAVRPKHMSVLTAKSTEVTKAAVDEDSDSLEAEQ